MRARRDQYVLLLFAITGCGAGTAPGEDPHEWREESAGEERIAEPVQPPAASEPAAAPAAQPTPAEQYAEAQRLADEAKAQGGGGEALQARADALVLEAARGGYPEAVESAEQAARRYLGADDAKAFELFVAAASHGRVRSAVMVGLMFENGEGTAKDLAAAEIWYRRAAEQENPYGMYLLGVLQWRAQKYSEALAWLEKAAARESAEAAAALGRAYRAGDHVPQDVQRGIDWLRKAADLGSVDAQYDLGAAYWSGKDVLQDYARAASYLEKAAAQGHSTSMWILATMHERGDYYPRNDASAVEWYEKAVAKGNTLAAQHLAALLEWGRGAQQDLPRAAKLYEQACDDRIWKACTSLGKMLKDKDEAARFFNKACDAGEYDACKEVGRKVDVFDLKRRLQERAGQR
jgi:TPR repeat protein